MKKVLSIILVLALMLTLFVGCAKSPEAGVSNDAPSSNDKAPANSSSTEKVELTIALWGDEARKAAYMETLAPFCEANNCTVNIELIPVADFFDKIAAQLGAGTAPDVFWLADGREATFVNAGWCADLKDTLEAEPGYMLEDFYESAIYSTDINGEGAIYGVPFSFGSRVIYYNKTIFEEAGVETPDECIANGTWTYEKMFELAAAITEHDPTKIGAKLWCVGQEANSAQAYADILSAYGANLLNANSTEFMLDSDAGIAVTQMLYDAMYTTGGHAKPGDTTAFVSGNIAMAREPYSNMKTLVQGEVDFEWDVVPMPYGSKGADAPLYTGYAYWCANATSENADLAEKLIAFVTNPENQLEWCGTFMCPRNSVMTSDAILNLGEGYPSPERVKAAFVDPVNEQGLFALAGTGNFTLLLNAVQQNYELIWAGQYGIEEGISAMKDAVEPYLN